MLLDGRFEKLWHPFIYKAHKFFPWPRNGKLGYSRLRRTSYNTPTGAPGAYWNTKSKRAFFYMKKTLK